MTWNQLGGFTRAFGPDLGLGFLSLGGLQDIEVCISKDDPPIMKISTLALHSFYC